MAGANQLLPGFNHNVKHQGRQYHVQTEDSGTANPHVITHLFLGGNILASKKTSYAELVAEGADLAARVRQLMEAQHKEMLRQLVRGAFDAGSSRSYQPGEIHVAPPAAATPAPPADAPEAAPAEPAPGRMPRVIAAPELPGRAPRPVDGWGPPVLPRSPRPPPAPVLGAAPNLSAAGVPPALPGLGAAPAVAAEPALRRLDELILSYLAGVHEAKRDGR